MKSKGWIFILLIVAFSCSSENDTIKLFKKDKVNNNLLNLAIFQSELESMLAFPVLFNDSIVKKNKIATIKRKQLYKHNENDGEVSEVETDKIITYFFDENGHNSKIKVERFYDIKSIEKNIIHFLNSQRFHCHSLKTASTKYLIWDISLWVFYAFL